MAAMPTGAYNLLKIFFPGTNWPIAMELGMKHWRRRLIIVSSNYDRELTLTLFYAIVKFCNLGLYVKYSENY